MSCNNQNFPYKSFYNDEKNEIYTFYRQGHSFTVNPDNLEKYSTQRIIDLDLGQMIFIFNKALAVRSSGKVLFFRQEWNHFEKRFKWINYHMINVRGFLYFIKGNIRI